MRPTVSVVGDSTPARRKRRKRRKPSDDGSLLAWRAIVLAIDTATRSGWAVRQADRLTHSGELDTLDDAELSEVVRLALAAAARSRLPCVLVLERPWGGHQNSVVVAALGAARERWLRAWRDAQQSEARVVSVHVSTWRSGILGRAGIGKAREIVRALELATARAELGASPYADDLGEDEAAAILISRWAARAPQVGAVLGKRVRQQSAPLPLLAAHDAREQVRR